MSIAHKDLLRRTLRTIVAGVLVFTIVQTTAFTSHASAADDTTSPSLSIADGAVVTTSSIQITITEEGGLDTVTVDGTTVAYDGTAPEYSVVVSGEGEHTIVATDQAGNPPAEATFTIDSQAPESTIAYSPATLTNTDVTATISTNEPIDETVLPSGWSKVNDTEYQKLFSSNTSETVTLKDAAGNAVDVVVAVNWIDKDPPTFGLVNGGVYASSSVQVVVTEAVGIASILVDGTAGVYAGTAPTYSVLVSGEGYHTVVATDLAGNTRTIGFTIDSVAPGVVITNAGQNTDGTYTITGTTTDVSAVWVSIDGGEPSMANVVNGAWAIVTGVLTEGAHTVDAFSTDGAGNRGYAAQFALEVPGVQIFTAPIVALGAQAPLANDVAATQPEPTKSKSDQSEKASDTAPAAIVANVSGLAWYWWLAIVAGLITLWLIVAAVIRAIKRARNS